MCFFSETGAVDDVAGSLGAGACPVFNSPTQKRSKVLHHKVVRKNILQDLARNGQTAPL